MGKSLVLIGIIILAIGLFVMGIEWFTGGRGLPGDITIRRDGLVIWIPIATMIILSLLLTLVLNLIARK